MRIILLNPYEFDSSSSEEMVGVAYAPMNEHSSDDAFINDIRHSTQGVSYSLNTTQISESADQRSIVRHLLDCIKRATGWSFKPEAITRVQMMNQDWGDKSAIFEIDGTRYWCCWFTTA